VSFRIHVEDAVPFDRFGRAISGSSSYKSIPRITTLATVK